MAARRRSTRNKSNRNNETNKSLNESQIIHINNNINNNNDIDYPTLKLEEDDDEDIQQIQHQNHNENEIENMNDDNDNEIDLTLNPPISNNHNINKHAPSHNTEQKEHEEHDNDHDNDKDENDEDPDPSNPTSTSQSLQLSYCRGLSKTPLAVPMVADTNQQSVTRNDAKQITQTRLRRLKELSQRPEQTLSKDQKDEKKRIIRLEKNRRAAAMSRRKKKMYVKNLEEKTQLMARHLAILEMENSHLRALLNATQQAQIPNLTNLTQIPNLSNVAASQFHGVGVGVGMPSFPQHFKLPHFQIPSLSTTTTNNSGVASNTETTNNSLANTDRNSVEVCNSTDSHNDEDMDGPSLKKRRLNNGSSSNTTVTNSHSNSNSHSHTIQGTLSPSCDNSSDVSILEPLPVPIPTQQNQGGNGQNQHQTVSHPPPPGASHHPHAVPINYGHLIPPNMAQLHASRLIGYHHGQYGQVAVPPHLLRNHGHINNNNAAMMGKINNMPKIDKIEAIVIDRDESETLDDINDNDENELDSKSHSHSNDDIPPPVVVSSRLSDEFNMDLLDDDIIDETVDESGSVLTFQQEMKTNMVYL